MERREREAADRKKENQKYREQGPFVVRSEVSCERPALWKVFSNVKSTSRLAIFKAFHLLG